MAASASTGFNFNAPAGVFQRSAHGRRGGAARYRRFESAALAIRYIMEEVPEPLWPGITVEIDDETLDHRRIAELYGSARYPLKRSSA